MPPDLPDYHLPRVVLIDHVELIDLISEITLLKTIESILNIDNIASVDLIDEITLIDTISEIAEINHIKLIDSVTKVDQWGNFIVNGGFETGDFTGWTNDGCELVTNPVHSGQYACHIIDEQSIRQDFPDIPKTQIRALNFYSYLGGADNGNNFVELGYSDETTTTIVIGYSSEWLFYDLLANIPDGKELRYIKFQQNAAVDWYVDDITLIVLNQIVVLDLPAITGTVNVEQSDASKLNATISGSVKVEDKTTDANKLAIDTDGKIGISSLPNVTLTAGGIVEIRDPNTTTQKLAVDANGKIGVSSLPNVTVATLPDVTQSDETKLKATVTQAAKDRTINSVDATATAVQINIAALNGNSAALTSVGSGKKVRLKFISIEHSADVDIGYRFGAAGTIYYMRISAGAYVSNLIGSNVEGAADANLYLYSSGATNVKGYILYEEV